MKKWEYCFVGPVGQDLKPISDQIGIGSITMEGVRFNSYPGKTNADLTSKLIAYLGDNGWELVGCGGFDLHPGFGRFLEAGSAASRPSGHTLYFKRIKEE